MFLQLENNLVLTAKSVLAHNFTCIYLNTVIFIKTKIDELRKRHQQYYMFSSKTYNLVIIPKIQKISLHE